MKPMISILAVLVLASHAQAAFLYKVDSKLLSKQTLQVLSVKDSIPQIHVIATENKIADVPGLQFLGEDHTRQFVKPEITGNAAPKNLWGLQAIEVERAWGQASGAGVYVGVSDTGVDSKHPELASNMWINENEIAGNGVDDDNNGFVDDIHGWNFVLNKPGGKDNHYHGTHVAGTIAARVSAKMAGVAPNAKIIDASFLDKNGSGKESNGAKSIIYLVDNGAKIINCSWGSASSAPVLDEAIAYAEERGVLVVAAAGNASKDTDRTHFYPAGIKSDNIVSVGSSSSLSGGKSPFSNYGKTTVDLAAPGSNIYSLSPSSGYRKLSGTSMASPHVAGVAALILSGEPGLTYAQVKERLMDSSVNSKFWKDKSISSGILNAAQAVGL